MPTGSPAFAPCFGVRTAILAAKGQAYPVAWAGMGHYPPSLTDLGAGTPLTGPCSQRPSPFRCGGGESGTVAGAGWFNCRIPGVPASPMRGAACSDMDLPSPSLMGAGRPAFALFLVPVGGFLRKQEYPWPLRGWQLDLRHACFADGRSFLEERGAESGRGVIHHRGHREHRSCISGFCFQDPQRPG